MRSILLAAALLFAVSSNAFATDNQDDPGTILFPPLGCSEDTPYISWSGKLGDQTVCHNGQHVLLNALPHCKDKEKIVWSETCGGHFICVSDESRFRGARIMLGSDSPIPNGTQGDPNRYSHYVLLDHVNYDTDNFYTAPGTLTIPAGVKKIRATANVSYDVPFSANTDALLVCGAYRARASAGYTTLPEGENGAVYNLDTGVIDVKQGDTCRIYYFQNSGHPIIISNGNPENLPNKEPTCPCFLDNWMSVEVVEADADQHSGGSSSSSCGDDFSRIPVGH
jgi:hypothetical protein